MPKIVDYPLAPFEKVKELADAVDYLGGSCTIADCAHHMKKKVSGGFGILISSAIKHDLIIRRRDRLFVTDLYKSIKLSYNAEEKIDYQRRAFFHPALYKKISERFRNKELPLAMLDKLLIREFQVEEKVSQKIAGFFVEGLKRLQLLREGKLLISSDASPALHTEEDHLPVRELIQEHKQAEITFDKKADVTDTGQQINTLTSKIPEKFTVSVQGVGIDTTIVISKKEDYVIIEAILEKIKNSLLS